MHYYKFNIKDWSRDTAHLTLEEEGVYRRLLDHYYESEMPISTETKSVIRRLRLAGHEDATSTVLGEFFQLAEDGYRHKRCDDEIEKYHSKAVANRENGKRGGRPAKPKENPDGSEEEPKDNLNQEPLTTNHNKIKSTSSAPRRDWVAELVGLGVSSDHAKDWLEVRRAKKAKMTDTALKGVQREAAMAGMSLAQAIKMSAENSWQGFKAEWAMNKGITNGRAQENRPLSAVDRVKAGAAERERIRQREQPEYFGVGDCIEGEFTSGPKADGPPLDSYGGDIWAQVD